VLMENYRRFIDNRYSVRQLLVEHTHFNDAEKRDHIRSFFERAVSQGAIPIVNYNDPVSFEENRKMELTMLKRSRGASDIVECIDNDETASVIAQLVQAKRLLIMSSVEGIYRDPSDPSTIIETITASTPEETVEEIHRMQSYCVGASRAGANGAWAKLEYIIKPVLNGTQVIIGSARHRISELVEGKVPCTRIGVGL